MRTRFAIGTASAVLLLVLGLPATTMATTGSYSHTVLTDVCSNPGGAFGHGYNALTVKMVERGDSGVIQLAARAVEQEYSGGSWQTIKEWPWDAILFGSNAQNHSWTYGKRFDLRSATSNRHRMMMNLRFGNGTAYPVAREKVFGQAC